MREREFVLVFRDEERHTEAAEEHAVSQFGEAIDNVEVSCTERVARTTEHDGVIEVTLFVTLVGGYGVSERIAVELDDDESFVTIQRRAAYEE